MQQRWVHARHCVRRPQRVPTLSDAGCSSDGSTPGIVLPIVCRRQASCSPATACADAKRCSSVGHAGDDGQPQCLPEPTSGDVDPQRCGRHAGDDCQPQCLPEPTGVVPGNTTWGAVVTATDIEYAGGMRRLPIAVSAGIGQRGTGLHCRGRGGSHREQWRRATLYEAPWT